MRITIKDVASRAEVSTATVSLVVHGNTRISDLTRKRVLKAIADLHYYPSRSARELVSKKTGNIGFVLTENHFLRTEPFYTKIFLGSELEARKHPYYILMSTIAADPGSETEDVEEIPRFILERSIDGLIVAGKVPSQFIARLEDYNFPVVYIDYYPPKGDFSAVLIDNIDGANQAVQHLIDCGHKDIGFLGGESDHPSINDRFQGYRMALERNGIEYNPENVIYTESPISTEHGYQLAEILFEKAPNITAFFACNDSMAIGAMRYLKENNYRIPEDVSIVGFDDIESDLVLDPPLTTIRVPKFDLGIEALKLMGEILDKKINETRKILMPVELIARKSTCQHN